MRIKVKLFSVAGIPASDGSIIPRHVIEEYLASDKYRNDIEGKKMLGSLTHLVRNWATQTKYTKDACRTAGKDDQLLTDLAAPTHYIDRIWIDDSDGWVYCSATILSEEGMDDKAVQSIRRLVGMLKQGIKPGVSAVILGYWNSENSHDTLARMQSLKGFDITLNPSWAEASVTDIEEGEERRFSAVEPSDNLRVKTFSGVEGFDLPKSSKISGKYTVLKAKEFSAESWSGFTIEEEKNFSVSTIKERVRYAKFSPRMRFRRLFLEYKQLVRQSGGVEKIDPETLKVMKSLFTSDVLDIFKQITPEIIGGKQVNTLIGASSLGKQVRVAAQKLQMPYRLAMQEMSKTGKVTPMRLQKVQQAYIEFTQAMVDEVFGNNPNNVEEEVEDGEN